MVALQKADGATVFLLQAPVNEFDMNVFFITGQCNPQIKNITQKDQIVLSPFNDLKHFKKGRMISPGLVNVGIGYNDHSLCIINRLNFVKN
jgi:hypothetical protein